MNEFSRRSLLGGAVAAAASTMWSEPVHAQYVWQKSNWQAAEFDALTHSARRIKLVGHGFAINDARFLKNAKNSLTGLQFGSGIPADQIQIVCALNGPANMLNYSDYRSEEHTSELQSHLNLVCRLLLEKKKKHKKKHLTQKKQKKKKIKKEK